MRARLRAWFRARADARRAAALRRRYRALVFDELEAVAMCGIITPAEFHEIAGTRDPGRYGTRRSDPNYQPSATLMLALKSARSCGHRDADPAMMALIAVLDEREHDRSDRR